MVQVEVTQRKENPAGWIDDLPCLVISDEGCVIYANKKVSPDRFGGVLLVGGSGYIRIDVWPTSWFARFNGTITLSNDK